MRACPCPASARHATFATTLTTVCVAVCVLGGCNGPAGEFYVVHNQVPSAGCVVPADKSAAYLGEGVLDVRVPSRAGDAAYILFPLLQNDLPADGTDGVEPNRIALDLFDIYLSLADGPGAVADLFATLEGDAATAALLHYQAAWSGSVDPGGGNTAAATNAFPAATAQRLAEANALPDGAEAHVVAKVRAHGQRVGGGITSDAFSYPIRICDGCLIHQVTACPTSGAVLQGGVCNPGQDTAVDCCMQGTQLICPATTGP